MDEVETSKNQDEPGTKKLRLEDKLEEKNITGTDLCKTSSETGLCQTSSETDLCKTSSETNLCQISSGTDLCKTSSETEVKEDDIEATNTDEEKEKCFKSTHPVLLVADTQKPLEITKVTSEFKGNDCFTKGCKWSPDGTCLLTNSNDNMLRLWDLPTSLYNTQTWSHKNSVDLKPAVTVREGGLVYDYCWYPLMSSWDAPTCCFATASRGNPGHLWDAFTGCLRATYRAYNQVDEVEPARCVAIDPTGERLYFGFNNSFRVFQTSIPGRECTVRNLKTASRDCQCGIVSCITACPAEPNLYAVGTYLKTIGLYSELEENVLCVLRGHEGGLTHLLFSPDGLRLYSGARMDSEILCWDLREPGKVLFSISRKVTTHQRIYFDLTSNGRYLVSGTMDGYLSVWDTESPCSDDGNLEPLKTFKAHGDCVNGVSAHPFYTILASCSGQRHFVERRNSSSESESSDDETQKSDNSDEVRSKRRKNIQPDYSLKLWWSGPVDEDEDQ